MRLLLFSDIHSDLRALERLVEKEADYYFAVGDLVNWGKGLNDVGHILQRRGRQVYVMPGNHESASDIAVFCDKYGLNDFHGQHMEVAGYHVAGLGYSNITPFKTPGEYTEEQIADRLSHFGALEPLILLCHCPPKNTPLDRSGPGQHFGSTAVAQFIGMHHPEYFFCGHIHEAAGVETQIGTTKARNLGKQGYLLELESEPGA